MPTEELLLVLVLYVRHQFGDQEQGERVSVFRLLALLDERQKELDLRVRAAF
ncbi:MAG: hypothetical protein IT381_25180 [Deltaproteobacteria bacterium]|nr:hypothetical protein [Deltaproteobacteria bacterium]